MSASVRLTKTFVALDVVIKHFAQIRDSAAAGPGFERLAAEVDAVLEGAAEEAEQILSALVGPVWAELPESVQAVCMEALTK